nr:hypothetical protein [Starkeya sp. ORNL1]
MATPPDHATQKKLAALRDRLLQAQRELIVSAADVGIIPSDNVLRKIADLEVTIGAVETSLYAK